MPPIRRSLPYLYALSTTVAAHLLTLWSASLDAGHFSATRFYLVAVIVAARWWGLGPAALVTFTSLGLLDWYYYEPGVFGPTREYFLDGSTFFALSVLLGRTYDVLLRNRRDLERQRADLHQRVLELTKVQAALTTTTVELEERNAFLSANEQRFKALADTIPAKVFVTDASRECVWVNNRWMVFTGQSRSEALGWGWMDVVHPDDQERVATLYRDAFDNHTPFTFDYRVRRHDGEYRWIECSGCPWLSDSGQFLGYMGAGMDVTLRYEAEAKIKELTEAKSNFLAVMSHELRTPLTAIIGYASLLEEGLPEPIPAACLGDVVRIRSAAEDLLKLIVDVLEFNSLETARTKVSIAPVPIPDTMTAIQTAMQPLARKRGLSVAVDTTYAPILLHTDSEKLRVALLNLVSNALKFTKSGVIVVKVQDHQDFVAFQVTDPGCGIPEADLERIFEPFFQSRQTMVREVGGMGLGLAAVRKIAELLGGDLVVDSKVGIGSTFTLNLPK